ncbi:uncharacterized protein [Anabrus simplex]|uniref:uncharacterized protein n=1 Tax=Anabrus simplex TaxID=316456 RepID=UPI0035A27C04
MGAKDVVKSCIVPMCTSTSITTPNKLFINVPKSLRMRYMWMKAARVTRWRRLAKMHFCEDHFELVEDLDKEAKFKVNGGQLLLKRGVIPRFFDCQNRSVTRKSESHKSYLSLVHKENEESALSEGNSEESAHHSDNFEFVTVDEDEIQGNDADISESFSDPMGEQQHQQQQSPPPQAVDLPMQFVTCNQQEPQVWMYGVLAEDGTQQAFSPVLSCVMNAPSPSSAQANSSSGTEGLKLAYGSGPLEEPQQQQQQHHNNSETSFLVQQEVFQEVVSTNREVAAAIKELAEATYLLATAKKRTAKADVMMAKIELGKAKKEGLM